MIKRLLGGFDKLNDVLAERLEDSMQFVTPFSVVVAIASPVFLVLLTEVYMIWIDAMMVLLSVILLALKHMKQLNIKYLPLIWLIFLTVCFPLNFSYGLFLQPDDVNYALGEMFMFMVIIIIVTDFWMALLILGVGIYLASAIYNTSMFQLSLPEHVEDSISLYVMGIVFGIILSRKKENERRSKLRAMYTLARSISHEINTPLAVIKMNAQQLAKSLFPSQQEEIISVKTISQECTAMKNMISILLINSQQSAEVRKHYKLTAIYKTIDRALNRYPYSRNSTFKKTQIDWQKSHDFNFLGMDLLMEHVWLNLLKNAIRSLIDKPDGKIIIWNDADEKYNNIYFKDTGTGISKEHKKNMFKSFFTTDPQGTGLGLYFCKKTIESFGGKILFKSELGEYTTFIISLPIK